MATSLPYYGPAQNNMGPFQNPQQQVNPYGYGQAPGQTGLGYFEQQTPAGSFAAAEQQFGQSQQAANPYIGQQSAGIGGQQSVMPWAQQAAQIGQQANPYLGQQSAQAAQVGGNAYGGGNPYLQQGIDAASQDTIRNYNTAIRPQLDSLGRASGSFGNTGIQELQQNAMSDLGRNLGNIASGMRMQDYTQQQQLAENALNRQQSTNQFNANLGAGDLSRNMSGFLQGQNIGLQGLSQALGGAQFDATMGNNVGQFNANLGQNDLNRNSNLAQGLSQFNAGQGNAMSQFNAGQGNSLNQFNAGSGNSMLSQFRNLGQQQNQFDQNMDYQVWNGNNQLQRQGVQDQLSALGQLMGWNQSGVSNATNVQNTPLQYLQQLMSIGNQAGQNGGQTTGTSTNAQNLQGNQVLGALGGWLAMQKLFGG